MFRFIPPVLVLCGIVKQYDCMLLEFGNSCSGFFSPGNSGFLPNLQVTAFLNGTDLTVQLFDGIVSYNNCEGGGK